MCELFGVSSSEKVYCNDLLKVFFSHSEEHNHGWGLATFNGTGACVEKEPIPAYESSYLKTRMSVDISEKNLLAHIRRASRGIIEYRNNHPFILTDNSNRVWTVIHNGTIFECDALEKFRKIQEGNTDSERICLYMMECLNQAIDAGVEMTLENRFDIIEKAIKVMTPENKINLMIFDGEIFYMHTNHAKSLYRRVRPNELIVSTKALEEIGWEEVPINKLFAYSNGALILEGEAHKNEFFLTEEKKAQQALDYEEKVKGIK